MNARNIVQLAARRATVSRKPSSLTLLQSVGANQNVLFKSFINQAKFGATQFRSVAIETKRNNPGYLDSLYGEYEDPNYKLDNKPEEFRQGEFFYYVSDFGIMILCVPTISAILLCFSMLTWYTFFDSQSQILRDDPLKMFGFNSGADLHETRNPILMWAYPFGAHVDRKIHFYYEIQDAISRKKSTTNQ